VYNPRFVSWHCPGAGIHCSRTYANC